MTTANATVFVNRDATAQDASDLLAGYKLLAAAKKDATKAAKAVDEGWIDGTTAELRAERDEAQFKYDAVLDQVWDGLHDMPKGTVCSGGMTPQTVGLEFFNRNLNREGGRRITAGQARKINSATIALSA